MRIAFMGTPDFSVPAFDALLAAGHEIAFVYTQPPRPAGRGQKERKSPVHLRAESENIEVRTPVSLKDPEAQAEFAALELEVAVVVAYGLILPQPILDAPRRGCINIHASLLPRWRGAAPIQRAMLAGDTESGVTIMQMDAGLDTGPELLRGSVAIPPVMNAGELHDALSELGGGLIVDALAGLEAGTIMPIPQSAARNGSTGANVRTRSPGIYGVLRPGRGPGSKRMANGSRCLPPKSPMVGANPAKCSMTGCAWPVARGHCACCASSVPGGARSMQRNICAGGPCRRAQCWHEPLQNPA